MTEQQELLYKVEDGIAIITLNRPDRLNAYTPAMGNEVVEAFRSARDDEDVRVILLTGAGRAFCAGVDLEVLSEAPHLDEVAEHALRGWGAADVPEADEEDFGGGRHRSLLSADPAAAHGR